MLLLFLISATGILLPLVGYPIALLVLAKLRSRPHRTDPGFEPTVTLIVACHDPGELLERKIANSLELDYPSAALSLVIVSDGSTDGTPERLRALRSNRVHGIALEPHLGKAVALNHAIGLATGEVLVFTDVDAQLPADTLRKLARHFADPQIGGVCGQRRLDAGGANLHDAQASYVSWDSRIKRLESQIGSTTSNDGKLYALRRETAEPIADGVTDDLYASLGVIARGWRFIFDASATALVPTPARSPAHEITRRRRVVARSLRGIYLRRRVLQTSHRGSYVAALIVNKVLRRCLPFLLITLLVSNLALASSSVWFALTLIPQLALYGLAAVGASMPQLAGPVGKLARRAYYVLLGMFGTALGVWDFVNGRTFVVWNPLKS